MPDRSVRATHLPLLTATVLGLVVLGPLVAPGYLLLLDSPAGPVEGWQTYFPKLSEGLVSSAATAINAMNVIGAIHPQLPNKLVIAGTVIVGGYGMIRFLQSKLHLHLWAAATGGVLFVINPWVYERMLAGQITLTLSYALLPFALPSLTRLALEDERRDLLIALAWTTAITIVDIHGGAMALLLIGGAILFSPASLGRKIVKLVGSAALFLAINLYWVLPSFLAEEGARLGSGDFLAYSPLPRSAAILPRVFLLHGFWREEFPTPLEENGAVFVVAFLALAVAAFAGLVYSVGLDRMRRPATALAVCCLVAVVLGMGRSFPLTRPIARFMFEQVPGYGIFREPQKWIAILALGYAVFAAVGLHLLSGQLSRINRVAPHALAAAAVLPLIATSNMLWGFGGHVELSRFPEGWERVEEIASREDGAMLAMPWNLYQPMRLTQGRFVANPLPHYFSSDVLISGDPRLFVRNDTPPADPRDAYVEALLRRRDRLTEAGALLAPLGARWVVLVHEADWRFYTFLNKQEDLRIAYDDDDVTLYENASYRGDVYGLESGEPPASIGEFLRTDPAQRVDEFSPIPSGPVESGLPGPNFERSWPWWDEIETPPAPSIGTSHSCLDGWQLDDTESSCHLGAFAAFPDSEGGTLWRRGILVQAIGLIASIASVIGLAILIHRERKASSEPGTRRGPPGPATGDPGSPSA